MVTVRLLVIGVLCPAIESLRSLFCDGHISAGGIRASHQLDTSSTRNVASPIGTSQHFAALQDLLAGGHNGRRSAAAMNLDE
jgi:hypothetical protein